jgi:quinol monooxygenase YgiN
MASVLVRLRVRDGCERRFEELAQQAHATAHARDSGLRRYEYWRGATPGSYYVLESYEGFADFLRHQRSDHHRAMGPELRHVIEAVSLEWIDAVPEAAPAWPTQVAREAIGIDDPALRRLSGEVQPWWAAVGNAPGETL